jgi:hypothetical protein
MLFLGVVLVLAAAVLLLGFRANHARCPRCGWRHAVHLAGSWWRPLLYCARCRHEWSPPMIRSSKQLSRLGQTLTGH